MIQLKIIDPQHSFISARKVVFLILNQYERQNFKMITSINCLNQHTLDTVWIICRPKELIQFKKFSFPTMFRLVSHNCLIIFYILCWEMCEKDRKTDTEAKAEGCWRVMAVWIE